MLQLDFFLFLIIGCTPFVALENPSRSLDIKAKALYESASVYPHVYLNQFKEWYKLENFREIIFVPENYDKLDDKKNNEYQMKSLPVEKTKSGAAIPKIGHDEYMPQCIVHESDMHRSFYDFMSMLVDNTHKSAEIVRKGIFIQGEKIPVDSLATLARDEEDLNRLTNILIYAYTFKYQLLDGQFSDKISEELRADLDNIYILWFFDLRNYDVNSRILSNAIEELFYPGWFVYSQLTCHDDKLILKVQKEVREFPLPKSLWEKFRREYATQ